MEEKVTAGELRKYYVHAHSNLLGTLGIVGAILYKDYRNTWKEKLKALQELPWERTDNFWEGNLATQGRMNKTKIGMQIATNKILKAMKITLDENRQKFEES